MSRITTISELRTYIKQELGSPVINIEVADDQIDQAIGKTVQMMNRYNYGDGTYLDYAIFTTTAGQAYYSLADSADTSASYSDIEEMVDFHLSFGQNGLNTLFSPQHILLQEMQGHGGFFGTEMNWAGYTTPGLELASYQIQLMYLQQIQETVGKIYTINWIPGRRVLHITPTPTETLCGVLQIYRRETAENLYDNILVKNLSVAYVKEMWGNHLRKHQMNLPGGGTNDGQQIRQEAKEEINDAIEAIKMESAPPDFFIG